MTAATLAEVLQPALRDGYAVAGLVCQGWEDMRAYVAAAEAEGAPVILQVGPGARAHTPLAILARMMRTLAESASIPVVIHLDHGEDAETCRAAIGEGFTSVMYDGSRLPFAENLARTAEIARLAHEAGVSCEGELGFVGYAGGAPSRGTDPAEAARFASGSGVDALAVSVGNLHLQVAASAEIDEDRLHAVAAATRLPLVIHGGSGVPFDQRRRLATTTSVCKFNIGTELRQAFGKSLRKILAEDTACFDRIDILAATEPELTRAARPILGGLLGRPGSETEGAA
jgi:fructose-bisphosphate aldolase class II